MKFKKYLVASLCLAAIGVTAPNIVQAGNDLAVQAGVDLGIPMEIRSMEDEFIETEFENIVVSADGKNVYFDGDHENPLRVIFEGEGFGGVAIINPEEGISIHFNEHGIAEVSKFSETTLRQFGFPESESEQFIHDSSRIKRYKRT